MLISKVNALLNILLYIQSVYSYPPTFSKAKAAYSLNVQNYIYLKYTSTNDFQNNYKKNKSNSQVHLEVQEDALLNSKWLDYV